MRVCKCSFICTLFHEVSSRAQKGVERFENYFRDAYTNVSSIAVDMSGHDFHFT